MLLSGMVKCRGGEEREGEVTINTVGHPGLVSRGLWTSEIEGKIIGGATIFFPIITYYT